MFPRGSSQSFRLALKIVEVDEEAAEVGVLFLLDKQKVLDDIQFRGAISDFANSKKKIEAVEGDELAMLYNPNDKFGDGNNWILVVSAEVQAQLIADVEAQREAYEEEKRREQEDIERIAREKAERKANRGRPKGAVDGAGVCCGAGGARGAPAARACAHGLFAPPPRLRRAPEALRSRRGGALVERSDGVPPTQGPQL